MHKNKKRWQKSLLCRKWKWLIVWNAWIASDLLRDILWRYQDGLRRTSCTTILIMLLLFACTTYKRMHIHIDKVSKERPKRNRVSLLWNINIQNGINPFKYKCIQIPWRSLILNLMTALLTAQLCDTKAVATTLQIFKLDYKWFRKCSHAD